MIRSILIAIMLMLTVVSGSQAWALDREPRATINVLAEMETVAGDEADLDAPEIDREPTHESQHWFKRTGDLVSVQAQMMRQRFYLMDEPRIAGRALSPVYRPPIDRDQSVLIIVIDQSSQAIV